MNEAIANVDQIQKDDAIPVRINSRSTKSSKKQCRDQVQNLFHDQIMLMATDHPLWSQGRWTLILNPQHLDATWTRLVKSFEAGELQAQPLVIALRARHLPPSESSASTAMADRSARRPPHRAPATRAPLPPRRPLAPTMSDPSPSTSSSAQSGAPKWLAMCSSPSPRLAAGCLSFAGQACTASSASGAAILSAIAPRCTIPKRSHRQPSSISGPPSMSEVKVMPAPQVCRQLQSLLQRVTMPASQRHPPMCPRNHPRTCLRRPQSQRQPPPTRRSTPRPQPRNARPKGAHRLSADSSAKGCRRAHCHGS